MGVEAAFYTLRSPPHQRGCNAALLLTVSPTSPHTSALAPGKSDGMVRRQTQSVPLDVTEAANDDGVCPRSMCASAFPSHLMRTALGMGVQSGVMPKWPSTFPTLCAGASHRRPTAACSTRL